MEPARRAHPAHGGARWEGCRRVCLCFFRSRLSLQTGCCSTPNAPGAASQGALVLAGESGLASFLPQPEPGALLPSHPGMLSGALVPLGIGAAAAGALPTRPHLPEDPVIPFNGFATHDEAE